MKTFSASLIFLGFSSLSIVCAQPFRPGGPFGPGGGPGMGGGGGSNNGNQPMSEAQFMGMQPPPDGKRLALSAADQARYDEYVKNFNSGQGGNQNSQGQNNFGGPGGPGGFGGPGGPGGFGGPGGPGGFGGPGFGPGRGPMGPGGPGGPFGPGGPNGPGGPFGNQGGFGAGGAAGGAAGQNSGANDYNSVDSYPSGDNQEALAMVNEVINDGNYSPQEKVALKSSAADIAREFVHEEEVRAGYNTYSGSQKFSDNSQPKMVPLFENLILLSFAHLLRWFH